MKNRRESLFSWMNGRIYSKLGMRVKGALKDLNKAKVPGTHLTRVEGKD